MIRTIIWYIFFWVYMCATIMFHIPLFFIWIFRLKNAKQAYFASMAVLWARAIIWVAGGTVRVTGKKNLPAHKNICYVSNHQGVFDIPLIMGFISPSLGFIAKRELRYIPFLGYWMKEAGCIFINRSKRRESINAIKQGVENINNGFPMVIFPEGTRSKNKTMGPFKSGSLKLAVRSKASIVPITIDGSYNLREKHGWKITPASIHLTVHPLIDASKLEDDDTKKLAERLWKTIHSALEKK